MPLLNDRSQAARVATIEEIRAAFPALERRHEGFPVAYLDGPGGTQVPRVVVEAMADYLLHHNANTHWAFPTSAETDLALAEARQVLADFVGASSDEIAFGPNMTTLTFRVSRAIGRRLRPGDTIVVTELDHHANIDPWRALEKERGILVRQTRMIPETGQLDWDDLERSLSQHRTKLLAIGAASNALGTINDVARAVAMAHESDALAFVDAVHFAPHQLVDVASWGCDFLAASAYKFHGPHVGVLYGRRELLRSLDVTKLRPAPDTAPERLETGTQNHEGIVGAAAAVEFLAGLAGDRRNEPRRQARSAPSSMTRRQRLATVFEVLPRARLRTAGAALGRLERHSRGSSLRASAVGPANADSLADRREAPGRRGRRPAGSSRDLRVARELLRPDRDRTARPGARRTGSHRLCLLHHRERGGPGDREPAGDRPRSRLSRRRGRGSRPSTAASMAARGSGSARRWSVPTTIKCDGGRPLLASELAAVGDRYHVVLLRVQDRGPRLDRAGDLPIASRRGKAARAGPGRSGMFMATAPPRDEPTTTSGRARRTRPGRFARPPAKSSSGRAGLSTV